MSTLIVIVFGIRADVHMLIGVQNAKVHFSLATNVEISLLVKAH